MNIIYHVLACSYYEGLVIALEVCYMSPPLRNAAIW